MRSAAFAALLLTCSGLHGCADQHGAAGDEIGEVTGNLIVSAAEGVSQGRAMSAADVERLDAEMKVAPAPLEEEPAALLAVIPRLTGGERVNAINDYVSYAHGLPERERSAAIMQLAALWKRGTDTTTQVPAHPPPAPPPPPSAITSCTISFGQSTALSNMTFYQAYGFAETPWYKHHCSSLGWNFKVDESGGQIAGHYHFWSDDPAVNCITTSNAWPNGVMGKDNGTSTCTPVNPLSESRDVTTHGSAYWVRIRNVTSTNLAWRAMKIKVKGTKEVRVKIDNTDGSWWEYTHLTPGLTWTLLPNGHKAKTAWVMTQNQNSGTPPTFDNFTIAGPL